MMIRVKRIVMMGAAVVSLAAGSACAQNTPGMLEKDKPIEISSDKLDVYQNEHKAIFTGNVIAVQGTTNMRSAVMTVFYRDSNPAAPAKADKKAAAETAPAAAPAAAATAPAQGIYRIEAENNVVFTTPTETAVGDKGIYNVDSNTIDLTGNNVTLTRGQNILKGTHVTYDMNTGRSVLTSGNGTATDVGGNNAGGKPARVHGLFVPKSDPKPAGK